jgi:enamine deaminase RidA (YjgF/YER057c/UK114 family)
MQRERLRSAAADPPAPLVRSHDGPAARWSLVATEPARTAWIAARARGGRAFGDQAAEAFAAVADACQALPGAGRLVAQTVFLGDPAQRPACEAAIQAVLGDDRPATTYVAQRPADGTAIAVEACAIDGDAPGVCLDRPEPGTTRIRQPGATWIHVAGIVGTGPTAYDQSAAAFAALERTLRATGDGLEAVIRTWLYLGDLLGSEGPTQRYMELNRARTDAYQGVRFQRGPCGCAGPCFPASTGIGAAGGALTLAALGLQADPARVRITPLENPRQTAAPAYAARYSPQSPKFCRGIAVSQGDLATFFISGTASITGSETRHAGDAAAQANQTLDNIEALIGAPNLERHGLEGLGGSLAGLGVARVYVKRAEDLPAVRAICASRLGSIPITWTLADVCRPELLVEIEGVAYARGG